jgi:FAD/FMN-containing dehydrogenase
MGKPFSAIHLHHLQGAVSRVAGDQSAFAHRDASFVLNIVAMWQDPAENDQHIAWARTFAQAIEPYAAGVYVNFLGNEGAERVKAAYGTNYARLADLKRAYDPTNFFHFNQNIPPATH